MLLVGSKALQILNPHLLDRSPVDVDLICDITEFQDLVKHLDQKKIQAVYPFNDGNKQFLRYNGIIYEFEIAWEGTTGAELCDILGANIIGGHWFDDLNISVTLPSLNVLFALKASHRFLKNSPHFLKTMRDYNALKEYGCHIPDNMKDWYKRREKATYTYSHPSLNQSKKDFFNGDGIKYVYDHDTIHLSMAIGERPAYTYFKKPGSEVMCDRELFDAAPYETQLASVLEETYVLALERSQIPFPGLKTPEWSFRKALEKVCTSITSGWWRSFAYDHYKEALANYDPTYVERFWKAVEDGTVKVL